MNTTTVTLAAAVETLKTVRVAGATYEKLFAEYRSGRELVSYIATTVDGAEVVRPVGMMVRADWLKFARKSVTALS